MVNEKMYCVFNSNGEAEPLRGLEYLKKDCIKSFEKYTGMTYKELKKYGWRVYKSKVNIDTNY